MSWRSWGPYVSERAWGTVREDYSPDGEAWDFFPHDHARSRVYRWNEDGMAGFCDESQTCVLSLGLWNGVDPILKERMFGLSGPQGNHGEDVKEYWWYLDGTPTHSWQTWRYHYPQGEFPYDDLVDDERRPVADRAGVRAGRHRHLRRRAATGWSPSTTPRPVPRPADADHRRERRAGRGDAARAADALVPQHLVVGLPATTSDRL